MRGLREQSKAKVDAGAGKQRRISITVENDIHGDNPMMRASAPKTISTSPLNAPKSFSSLRPSQQTYPAQPADSESDSEESDDLDEKDKGDEQPISKEGWMDKKGGYKRRNWKR